LVSFHNTDLADHLDGLGVTQVIISGVATSFGVESTARQAHEHGYHVTGRFLVIVDTLITGS
jgi:nicotinamidase-related amidase